MKKLLRLLLVVQFAIFVNYVQCDEELPDFDFEDGQMDQTPAESAHNFEYVYEENEKIGNIEDFESFFVDDELNVHVQRNNSVPYDEEEVLDFHQKELRLRKVLLRALAVGDLKRKFSEVMPMLRVMSKKQKTTLAALITAQVNAKDGRELTLDQVKQMFGDRPDLILPLVLDIANLIRAAAQKQREEFRKSDRYREHEKLTSDQLLRRSFNVNARGFEKAEDDSVGTIMVAPPPSHLRTDRLEIEEADTVNVKEHSQNEARSIDFNYQPEQSRPQALPLISAKKQRYEAMTYHERKLNMTTFNQTPKHKDQLAMPSDGPIPVTLPRIEPSQSRNMSIEEIEDMAFSSLNGTLEEVEVDSNVTVDPNSPMAEMLVGGRYRKRNPFRKGYVEESCERFTGGVCLRVQNYPADQIMGSIRRHKNAMEALLAEFRDREAEMDQQDYLGDPEYGAAKRREDSADENSASQPGSMCPSIIRYARPQKARSATGEWKFIVNIQDKTQTLRLEKCSNPQESCTYLTDNFRSRCIQIYNYHRLLSWDSNRGLHVDIFKVPTCCSCHIDGYKELFPPLAQTATNHLFPTSNHKDVEDYNSASSNKNSQYSTLNGAEYDDESEDVENIAYQFGNGFKRLKPQPKFESSVNSPPSKTRYDRNQKPVKGTNRKTLDSYLSPPSNDFEANYPFKRGTLPLTSPVATPGKRVRRPANRKQSTDQSSAGSEKLEISTHVTVLPPPNIDLKSNENFRKKVTPPITSTIDNNSVNLRKTQNIDMKRINYNYHPIIDFFEDEEEEEPKNALDKKSGKAEENSWKPMISASNIDNPRLRGH